MLTSLSGYHFRYILFAHTGRGLSKSGSGTRGQPLTLAQSLLSIRNRTGREQGLVKL